MTDIRVASLSIDNSQAKAAMAETEAGMRKVGDAAASVGQTTEKETARLRTYGREWQGVEKRMAGSAESLKKFEAMQGFAARAVEAGRLTQEQANEAVERYRLKLVAGAAAAERAAKAQESAAQSSARAAMEQARAVEALSREMDAGYAAQAKFSGKQQEVIDLFIAGALNGRQFAAAMKFVADSYDPATLAAKENAAALQEVMAKYDPARAEIIAHGREVARVTAILAAANSTDSERARVLAAVAAAYDPATRAANARAKALKDEAEAEARMAAEWEASMAFPDKKSFGIYGTGFQQDRAEFDSLFAASKKYEDQLNRLNAAHASGAIPNYDAALAELNAEFDRATGQSKSFADQQKAAADATARTAAENVKLAASYNQVMGAVDPAVAAEQRYQKALGDLRAGAAAAGVSMDQLAADEAKLTAAISPAALAAKKEEDSLRSLLTGLDRTWGATDKLAERQEMLDKAFRDGVNGIRLSREEYERFSKVLKDQHEVATRSATSTKLAAHESLNLGYQLQDFAVQVGSGQGFLTPLLQQAPQAVGAVGGMERAMALLTSRTALTVMGVGALGLAFGVVMGRTITIQGELREFNTLLKATGDQAGLTAEQMRGVAEGMMGGGASREEASTVVKNLVATRRSIGEGLAKDIGSLSIDMGTVFGGTTEAGKRLTEWVVTGVKGLREMAVETGALSVAQYEAARAAMEHGDREAALGIAIGALKDRFAGLHRESLSPAQQAMEDLHHAYNDLVNAAAEHPVVVNVVVVGAEVLREISKFIKDPMNFQFPTIVTKDTQFPTPFGIGNWLKKPNPTLSEGAITGKDPWLPPAPAGTPIPGRKPTQQDGVPLAEALALSDLTAANDKLLGAMRRVGAERVIETARVQAEISAINAGKSEKTAEMEGLQAARMARAQLVQAMDDNARAAAADVAGNELMAQAYGVSSSAVREATIHQKALAEAARGTIEPYDAIVARLRAVDDAQRAAQAAQFDATLRQQADDADRLAAAWGKGANAAREAALANEALGEARKRGLDPTRDAAEIQGIGQGVLARDLAQRTQQFAQMASEQRRAAEIANAEFDMLGASNAERAKTVAILQASNDLRDKGADLTDAGTKAYIEQAGEIAKVKSILQDAAQNAANIAQPISTAFEDVIVGAKGAGDAVKALGEDLKRIAARQLITKPFETAVSGALTRLMSGGVSVANDNRPTPANDPGGLDRLVSTVKGGLGSSASNPMWVTMTSGSAAFDVGALANGSPMPVAVKDAGALEGIIQQSAAKYGIDPAVIKGIIQQESSWNANAVNKTSGAAGLMQIMPANLRAYGVADAFDPAQNIDAGTRILKEHLVRAGGDLDKALSTYSGHVKTSGDAYVSAVKGSAATYAQAGNGLRLVVDNTRGVTAAQERQLQAMLDAVPAQRAATDSAQTLTTAQQSLVDSVLGTAKANTDAVTVVDVQSRAISTLGANAISVAEQMDGATDATKGLAKASEDSSSTLLGAAQSVYSGFTSVMSSLWSSVTSLFSSSAATGGGATVNGQTAPTGGATFQGLGSYGQLGSIASTGYQIYTGGGGLAGTAANWFATSSLGSSLGLSTAVPTANAIGVMGANSGASMAALQGSTNALSASGTSFVGGVSAGAPYGMLGGLAGSYLGNNVFGGSKIAGAASGAAIGAGSAAIGSYLATGAMMGPWGLAAAAVIAAITAALGTNKPSVGPNGASNIRLVNGSVVAGDAQTDNGASDEKATQIAQAAATSFAGLLEVSGGKMSSTYQGQDARIDWMEQTGKFTSIVGGVNQEFSSLEEAMTDMNRRLAAYYQDKGLLNIDDVNVKTALTNSKAKSPDEFIKDIAAARSWTDVETATASGYNPFDAQITAMLDAAKETGEKFREQFIDLKTRIIDLGLASEQEALPKLRTVFEAQLGLGTTLEPLRGLAAVTKQAEINLAAFRPAMEALGYTAEQQADLVTRYTAKMTDAYEAQVSAITRNGTIAVETAITGKDPTTATDMLRSAGIDPGGTGLSSVVTAIGAVWDAFGQGVADADRLRAAQAVLNSSLRDGYITGDQYSAVIQRLTEGYKTAAEGAEEATKAAADLTSRYNTASDRGVLNDVASIRKQGAADSLIDPAKATTVAAAALGEAFGKLTLPELQKLDGQFAGMPQVLSAFETAITKATKTATDTANTANLNIMGRANTALGRNYRSALDQFDSKALSDVGDTIANGGNVGLLIATQAVERNQTALDAIEQRIQDEIDYRSLSVASIKDTITAYDSLVDSLKDTRNALKIGDQSPLDPLAKMNEAQKQLSELYAKAANDNDVNAATKFQSLAATVLDATKGYYATSTPYADYFDTVDTQLGTLIDKFGDQSDPQRTLVKEAESQSKTLQDQLNNIKAQRAAIERTPIAVEALTAAATTKLDDLKTTISALAEKWTLNDGNNPVDNGVMAAIFRAVTQEQGFSGSTSTLDGYSVDTNRFVDLARALGYGGAVGGGQLSQYIYGNDDFHRRLVEAMSKFDAAKTAGLVGTLGYERGGIVGAYAEGGVVGNGLWGKDSVLARYAGGGSIALAGGEYVMPADMTAAYRPALDAMRAGAWDVANDRRGAANVTTFVPQPARPTGSGNSELLAELRALRIEVKQFREERKRDAQAQITVAAKAGDGTMARLDRVAKASEEQAAREKLRNAKAA